MIGSVKSGWDEEEDDDDDDFGGSYMTNKSSHINSDAFGSMQLCVSTSDVAKVGELGLFSTKFSRMEQMIDMYSSRERLPEEWTPSNIPN